MEYRTESDSLGEKRIETDKYWGCQTQRALENFPIGSERFPRQFIRALGIVKKGCALANSDLGSLSAEKLTSLVKAADEVIEGTLDDHFPLKIWQTGSGTQTNMNANEVIANRAIELLGGGIGSKDPVHPNDDVNKSQSSNDVFPTAMHIAAVEECLGSLLPAGKDMREALTGLSKRFRDIITCGRTHLQDAVPITLGQEFSCFAAQIEGCLTAVAADVQELYAVPIGGTAVGTGLNTNPEFGPTAAAHIADITGLPFHCGENKFACIAAHDGFVRLSGSLNTLACVLMKIANDIRLLGSGPRCGLGEITLPANEPGSSIMPGKVNPTQAEALTMICARVMGNATAVSVAGASGHLQLNAFKPVIIYAVLESVRLLAEGMDSFTRRCLEGIEPNREKIDEYVRNSLMLVTALNPHIGYEKASRVAGLAYRENLSLREAVVRLGVLSEEKFDEMVRPDLMTGPNL